MEYLGAIFGDSIVRAVISNPAKKSADIRKVVISLKNIGGTEKYQIESFTEKQAFHKNIEKQDIVAEASRIMEQGGFRQLDAWSGSSCYMLKISKKGRAALSKKRLTDGGTPIRAASGNNREKKYILGSAAVPALVDLGVITKEGNVVSAMYDKYR